MHRRRVPDGLDLRRQIAGQRAAADGLHDDDPEAAGGGQLQPAPPGLKVLVHVVELDLAELPQVGGREDLREQLVASVEAEAEVPDATVGKRPLGRCELALLDARCASSSSSRLVEQVEVDAVRLQARELDARMRSKSPGLDVPHRHLGGDLDLLAVSALEGGGPTHASQVSPWYIQAVST